MNNLTVLQKYSEGFLDDKKWWAEENDNFYTLFVEWKGKVYKEKMDKDYVKIGLEVKNNKILDETTKDKFLHHTLEGLKFNLRFCINKIKQQIGDDKLYEITNRYKQMKKDMDVK